MSYGIDQQKQGGRHCLLGTFPNALRPLTRPKLVTEEKMHQDQIPTSKRLIHGV